MSSLHRSNPFRLNPVILGCEYFSSHSVKRLNGTPLAWCASMRRRSHLACLTSVHGTSRSAPTVSPLGAPVSPCRISILAAFQLELLVVHVHGRIGFGEQHSLSTPRFPESRGAKVRVIGLVVARLRSIENQPHNVARMSLVELVTELGRNHVVGRSNHVGQ